MKTQKKVLIQLDEGYKPMNLGKTSPRFMAKLIGIDKLLDRYEESQRNSRFMEDDSVEDEEMMNRLFDGEDF